MERADAEYEEQRHNDAVKKVVASRNQPSEPAKKKSWWEL